MYIRNLELRNIMCFEEAGLSFTNQNGEIIKWTVILGENGFGKSTILKNIALLLAGQDAARELQHEPRRMVRFGCKEAIAEAEIDMGKACPQPRKRLRLSLNYVDKPYAEGWGDTLAKVDPSRANFEGCLKECRRSFFVCGYGATRVVPHEKDTKRIHALERRSPFFERLETLFIDDSPLMPVDDWLRTLEYNTLRTNKASSAKNRFKSATDLLSKLLPSVQFKEINDNGEAIFNTPYGEVSLSELSRGYQDVLSWVSDLARRLIDAFPDSSQPLAEEGIVLIEEISLHLHPIWQRKVIGFLRSHFPNIQFIATTHSPLVAQALQRNEFVVLQCGRRNRSHQDTIRITRLDLEPRGLSADQILTSPLFGLSSSRSVGNERIESELFSLKKLISSGESSEDQKKRYTELLTLYEKQPEAPGTSYDQYRLFLKLNKTLESLGRTDLLDLPPLKSLEEKTKKEEAKEKAEEKSKN